MATQLTPVKVSNLFPAPGAGAADFTFAAGDTEGNWFYASDRNLILVTNTEVADPKTITITSTTDPETGRLGHITSYSLAAGDFAQFWVGKKGWADSNGKISLTPEAATVKIAVIQPQI